MAATTLLHYEDNHPLAASVAALTASMAQASIEKARYRNDGVRMQHDPDSPAMGDYYGIPGETDPEGFDPYADTVGPGIYGGSVKKSRDGKVVMGKQYQNHTLRPGPVYDGRGYSQMSRALWIGANAIQAVIDKQGTKVVNEISTGGCTPLHMCGMSQRNEQSTDFIIEKGGQIEALDTYGYSPLHRMASNNLAIGAKALLDAGASPYLENDEGETPWETAVASEARDVLAVFENYAAWKKFSVEKDETKSEEGIKKECWVCAQKELLAALDKEEPTAPTQAYDEKFPKELVVSNSGFEPVNGRYVTCDPSEIPRGFAKVCHENSWSVEDTWKNLTDGRTPWFLHENGSFIYWNRNDNKWWMDGPLGHGIYTMHIPPSAYHNEDDHWPIPKIGFWMSLSRSYGSTPEIMLVY